ncbi:sulfotransferase [Actinoplanes sp. NPDC051411]|uniref:sulfotransferase family protein n=1 Tax=Actinoplanes sp. NPDC051411 TaxID=3155522 RepID=UPI003414300B
MTTTSFTEIADLAAPRLTPEMRAMCERIGRHDQYAAIDPERLMTEAAELTGLDDFGPDWFRTPLEVLCRALHEEGDLSPLGALTQRLQIQRLLCARLRVERFIKDHPDIDRPRGEPPIVIAGLPRSGTTFLHNLLAADPGVRALSAEEAEGPPEPAAAPAGDPALAAQRRLLDENLPLMKMMIDIDDGSTVEELSLLGLSFSSILFEIQGAPLPTYGAWFLSTDQTPAYEYLARVLRVLHWQRGGGPWVLKTIQHMAQLRPLTNAFPGATVVCTHRDPGAVVPSMSTLMAYGQRLSTRTVDPVRTAGYWTERVLGMVERCMRDRAGLEERQIVDVPFLRIRDDTDGVLDEIYARAGLPLTEPARTAMATVRANRHPHRHGRIRYDPAALGLDLDRIRERSAEYRARFAVPAES